MKAEEEIQEEVDEIEEDTLDDADIAGLSDEELKAKLNGKEEDTDAEDEEAQLSEEEGSQKEEEKDEEKGEAEDKEDEPENDDEKDTAKSKEKEDEGPTLEETLAENKKLKDQLDNKEEFAQQQSTRLGAAEKELHEHQERMRADIEAANKAANKQEEPTNEDPYGRNESNLSREDLNAEMDARDARRETTRVNAVEEDRLLTEVIEARTIEAIPDFKDLMGEISELAKADGIKPSAIETFNRNPFGSSPDAATLINYAKRAKDRIELKALKKKVKDSELDPDDVSAKIAETARRKSGLNGKVASAEAADTTPELSDAQIAGLSDEEVSKRLAKLRKGG
jgi:hypothetical protein